MTTLQTHGGGAQPASIDTSGKAFGGAALRVYGFDSEADAIAAGFVCEGGPAMSVALITDAQINAGVWRLEGDPAALVIYTAPAGMPIEGGYSVPVYPVNGWGSTPTPPAPVPPLFVSAEIGNVDNTTVVVTFDRNVSADENDFLTGVVVNVNGLLTVTSSGIRQSNHSIVYYAITTPVAFGDTVTWNYDDLIGLIVSESDGAPLSDVNQATVTNNVAADHGIALRADAVAYYKLDEVTGARTDSANGYNLSELEVDGETGSMAGKIGLAFLGTESPFRPLKSTNSVFSIPTTSFTWIAWVYRTNDALQLDIVGKEDQDLLWDDEYVLGLDQPINRFHFWFSTNTGNSFHYAVANSFGNVPLNEWHFVVGWFDLDALTLNIQVDNGSVDSISVPSGPDINTAPLYVGSLGGSNQWVGGIDEVGFWKRVLTPDERTYLWNSGAGRALFPAP